MSQQNLINLSVLFAGGSWRGLFIRSVVHVLVLWVGIGAILEVGSGVSLNMTLDGWFRSLCGVILDVGYRVFMYVTLELLCGV